MTIFRNESLLFYVVVLRYVLCIVFRSLMCLWFYNIEIAS